MSHGCQVSGRASAHGHVLLGRTLPELPMCKNPKAYLELGGVLR